MKKIGMICLLAVLCCQLGAAKTSVKKLVEKFAAAKEATCTEFDIAQLKSSGNWIAQLDGIESGQIYALDECDEKTQKAYDRAVRDLDDPLYEVLVTEDDEDDYVRILMRTEKKKVSELVIFIAGDDPMMIWLKGKINLDNVKKLVGKTHGQGDL